MSVGETGLVLLECLSGHFCFSWAWGYGYALAYNFYSSPFSHHLSIHLRRCWTIAFAAQNVMPQGWSTFIAVQQCFPSDKGLCFEGPNSFVSLTLPLIFFTFIVDETLNYSSLSRDISEFCILFWSSWIVNTHFTWVYEMNLAAS